MKIIHGVMHHMKDDDLMLLFCLIETSGQISWQFELIDLRWC